MSAVLRIPAGPLPRVGTGNALDTLVTPAARARRRAKRAGWTARLREGYRGSGAPPVSGVAANTPKQDLLVEPPPLTAAVEALWWHGDIASAYVAERLGFDLPDLLELTGAAERTRIADAMVGHVFTKRKRKRPKHLLDHEWVSTPIDRSARVYACGHLRPAFRGSEPGVAHWHCKDRLCPDCSERRANEYKGAARAFIAGHQPRYFVAGARGLEIHRVPILFVTLTQPKRPTNSEAAGAAFDRLMASWRRLQNTKSENGREFRRVFEGGARAVELKYARKGERNGAYVIPFSGWHPHFHALLQVRVGITVAEAASVVARLWREVSTGAKAPDIAVVDERRIGEICKYPLKLPSLATVGIIREAAMVLADRKTLVGFGSWRAILKQGRELRDEGKERPPPVHIADQRLGTLARKDGLITFTKRRGKFWDTETRDLRTVRESILADPRTFAQRDRDESRREDDNKQRVKDGLELLDTRAPGPPCPERRSWWDSFAPPPIGPPSAKPQPKQMEIEQCQTT